MPSFLMCGDCRPSREVGRSLPMRSLRVKCVGRCSERGGGGDDDVRGWAVVVVVIDSGFLALPLRGRHGDGAVVVVVAARLFADEVLDLAAVLWFPVESRRL